MRNGRADGARVLMRTLGESGVTVLFANPGTTELHMVEAAEATPGLRRSFPPSSEAPCAAPALAGL